MDGRIANETIARAKEVRKKTRLKALRRAVKAANQNKQ